MMWDGEMHMAKGMSCMGVVLGSTAACMQHMPIITNQGGCSVQRAVVVERAWKGHQARLWWLGMPYRANFGVAASSQASCELPSNLHFVVAVDRGRLQRLWASWAGGAAGGRVGCTEAMGSQQVSLQ
jgi:hypothetical protein